MNLKGIPILPVPRLVFYPQTSLPLFIVEPTYAGMIREAIENQSLLGITLAEPQVREGRVRYIPKMVCTVGKPILLEELDDGGLKILIHGKARVRLTNLIQSLPYLIFDAEEIPDRAESSAWALPQTRRLVEILDNWLSENITDSLEREHFQQNIETLQSVADYLCLFLIQDPTTKQIMLENTSLFERLSLLNGLLKGESPQAEDWMTGEALKEFETLEQKLVANH